jgi:uncharacterized BrkB/YihY/UPF0761 family membrane protein
MPKLARQKKRKALKGAIAFGILSAVLYLAVFLNQDTVMDYFTKGGVYGALPVLTAFLFSFVHGAFTGKFWTAVGVEASKKATRVELPATKPAKRVRPRPRAQMNA